MVDAFVMSIFPHDPAEDKGVIPMLHTGTREKPIHRKSGPEAFGVPSWREVKLFPLDWHNFSGSASS